MNPFRKTAEFVSESLRRPRRMSESDLDRRDQAAVDQALRDRKADPARFVSHEDLKRQLGD
jgi:hypothetical protein